MQTQQPVWKFLQKHSVVKFVVKTSVAAVVGLISVGGIAVGMGPEGTFAHAATSCPSSDSIHTIARGETWSALAARFNLTQNTLAAHNSRISTIALQVGQKICIPQGSRYTTAIVNVQTGKRVDVVAHSKVIPTHKIHFRTRAVPAPKPKAPQRAVRAAYNAVVSTVKAPVQVIPAAQTSSQSPVRAGGATNPYPYPACTWWADQRYYQLHGSFVPWTSNAMAWQWGMRASEFGWRVSSIPTVGAIMVLQPEVQGAGVVGHVAVVEQVLRNGAVIASSMNWGANPYSVTRGVFAPGAGVTFIS